MSGMKQQDMRSSVTVAAEELACYAACVFDPADVVEVRRLPSGRSTWHQAGNLANDAQSLFGENRHGEHVYAGANPRRFRGGTSTPSILYLWVESL